MDCQYQGVRRKINERFRGAESIIEIGALVLRDMKALPGEGSPDEDEKIAYGMARRRRL